MCPFPWHDFQCHGKSERIWEHGIFWSHHHYFQKLIVHSELLTTISRLICVTATLGHIIFFSLFPMDNGLYFQPCWFVNSWSLSILFPDGQICNELWLLLLDGICFIKEWFSLVVSVKEWYFLGMGYFSPISLELPTLLCWKALFTWKLKQRFE